MVGGGINEDALFRGSRVPGTTGLAFGVVGSSVECPFSIEGTSGGVIIDTSDEGDMQKGQTLPRCRDKGADRKAVGPWINPEISSHHNPQSIIQDTTPHTRRRNVGRARYLVAS